MLGRVDLHRRGLYVFWQRDVVLTREDGLKAAELAYEAVFEDFVPCGSRASAEARTVTLIFDLIGDEAVIDQRELTMEVPPG